ncbi:hypothetical protein RFI_23784, partial [Reticulomyxa filosa]
TKPDGISDDLKKKTDDTAAHDHDTYLLDIHTRLQEKCEEVEQLKKLNRILVETVEHMREQMLDKKRGIKDISGSSESRSLEPLSKKHKACEDNDANTKECMDDITVVIANKDIPPKCNSDYDNSALPNQQINTDIDTAVDSCSSPWKSKTPVQLCLDWLANGYCDKQSLGDNSCSFDHPKMHEASQRLCPFLNETGHCDHQDTCSFAHSFKVMPCINHFEGTQGGCFVKDCPYNHNMNIEEYNQWKCSEEKQRTALQQIGEKVPS